MNLGFATLLLAPFLAAFARTGAFLVAMPFVGDRTLPRRVRVGVAVVIAFALAPGRSPLELMDLPIVLPAEILLGLIAGFAGRIVVAGVEAGGQIIGQQIGLGFAGTFDPSMGEQEMPTTRLVRVVFGVAFFASGGLEACVVALAAPPPTAASLHAAIGGLISQGETVLIAGVRIAAPSLCASLVANLTAALASRAAPALNVFSVALSLLLVVGAIMLVASSPVIVGEISAAAGRVPEMVQRVLGGGF